MYLRLQEGIRDWFYHLQSSVYESKRRRKFWVKGPTMTGLGNNRLARLYGEKILHPVNAKITNIYWLCSAVLVFILGMNYIFVAGSDNNITEEDIGAGDDDVDRGDSNNNVPRGINRLSRESAPDRPSVLTLNSIYFQLYLICWWTRPDRRRSSNRNLSPKVKTPAMTLVRAPSTLARLDLSPSQRVQAEKKKRNVQ